VGKREGEKVRGDETGRRRRGKQEEEKRGSRRRRIRQADRECTRERYILHTHTHTHNVCVCVCVRARARACACVPGLGCKVSSEGATWHVTPRAPRS
jgi:hypothetical protein